MLQPEELREQLDVPMLAVEKIRINPYWLQLVKGRPHPQSVEIQSPKLTLSVEMLKAISTRTVVPKKPLRKLPEPRPVRPVQDPVPQVVPDEKKRVPVEKAPTRPDPSPSVAEPERTPLGMPVHLKISNAQFDFVSVSNGQNIFRVKGVDYDHVLLGEDSVGQLNIQSLQLLGETRFTDIHQQIEWKRPFIEITEQELDLGGVQAELIAQIGLGENRMGQFPFLIDFAIDRQEIESAHWFKDQPMEVNADLVASRLRVSGQLLRADSWRADGIVAAQNLSVLGIPVVNQISFDEVNLPFVVRQGTVLWSGVRCISEDIAVLGNGAMSLRDGHLSVTRIVASPEVASMLNQGIYGLDLVDDGEQWWYELATPDRLVRDIVVSGSLLEPQVDAGSNHALLPLGQLISVFHQAMNQVINGAGQNIEIPSAASGVKKNTP
jgi:hypothetical protein